MAKDTEKLIRQLSLISYLMAERRPVTAPEIRRDVEGYSVMNEDAFARRFYADRSELEALGHRAGGREAGRRPGRAGELLAAAGELPPAADRVHRQGAGGAAHGAAAAGRRVRLRRAAAAGAAADLVGAAEPARRARSRARSRSGSPARPAATTSRSAWPRSRRRSSAARRSCSTTTRWSATRSARGASTPTSCSTRAASSTSSGARTSAARSGSSGSRGSAARSATRPRPSTTSSARRTSTRARTPTGSTGSSASRSGTAEVWIGQRIAWQIERHFGATARSARPGGRRAGDRLFVTQYANARQLIAWVLGLGENARIVGPPELVDELRERVRCWWSATRGEPQVSDPAETTAAGRRRTARRPEPRARPRTQRQPPRRRDPARAVRPAGDAREHPDRRGPGRAAVWTRPRSAPR